MIGTGCQIQILLIKKYHVPLQVPSSCMCRKNAGVKKTGQNSTTQQVSWFFSRRYLHFTFFFWTDFINLLLALQLCLPQSPHSLSKPLTMLFFSSSSHHAKEQTQTLQTGVNSRNYSWATIHFPAPNWKPGMTVENLLLQTRVYELQV